MQDNRKWQQNTTEFRHMNFYTTTFKEAAKNKTVSTVLCKRISELELGIYYEVIKKKNVGFGLDLQNWRYSHSDLWLVTA